MIRNLILFIASFLFIGLGGYTECIAQDVLPPHDKRYQIDSLTIQDYKEDIPFSMPRFDWFGTPFEVLSLYDEKENVYIDKVRKIVAPAVRFHNERAYHYYIDDTDNRIDGCFISLDAAKVSFDRIKAYLCKNGFQFLKNGENDYYGYTVFLKDNSFYCIVDKFPINDYLIWELTFGIGTKDDLY